MRLNLFLCAAAIARTACNTPREAAEGATPSPSRHRLGQRSHELPTGVFIDDRLEDANGNGIDDATDIASGRSKDLNNNGIPDEAEEF